MKISTKGRYALRFMLEVALAGEGGKISIKTAASRQGLSEKYLEQLIPPLVRAGHLKSVRGAQGGYMLCREPADYTVGEILRAVEGSLAPVTCLDGEEPCARADTCATLEVWKRVQDAVNQVVDGITLQDVCDIQREKGQQCDGCGC